MLTTAIKAAIESGKLLEKNFGKAQEIRVKGRLSLVSKIDLESDKLIKKIIQSKYPKHNIISEETGRIDNKSSYTWHIDPIDGTHNYIRRIPMCGISIALEQDGEIVLGVISLPLLKKLYVAEKGKGAFCNNNEIRVSDKKNLEFSIAVVDFGHTARQKSLDFIRNISQKIVDIRNYGCAVYGLALVAQGDIDAYVIQKTNSWDVSAGFLLIEEAGGKVTNHSNGKWLLNEKAFVASNGKIHDKILGYL